jgi:hypothetical protein
VRLGCCQDTEGGSAFVELRGLSAARSGREGRDGGRFGHSCFGAEERGLFFLVSATRGVVYMFA